MNNSVFVEDDGMTMWLELPKDDLGLDLGPYPGVAAAPIQAKVTSDSFGRAYLAPRWMWDVYVPRGTKKVALFVLDEQTWTSTCVLNHTLHEKSYGMDAPDTIRIGMHHFQSPGWEMASDEDTLGVLLFCWADPDGSLEALLDELEGTVDADDLMQLYYYGMQDPELDLFIYELSDEVAREAFIVEPED